MPLRYSPCLRHSDETRWLPQISEPTVCAVAWVGPPAARARGHAGNRRLHARWQTFDERHKRVTVANAAIARELAGWCWSLAVLDD